MWGANKQRMATALLALWCLALQPCTGLKPCEHATTCPDDSASLLALRTRGPGSIGGVDKALAPTGVPAKETGEHKLRASCPDFAPGSILIRQNGKAVNKVSDWSLLALPLDVPQGGKLEVLVCNYGNIKTLGDHLTLKAQTPLVGSVGHNAHVDVLVVNSFNVAVYGNLEIVPDGTAGSKALPQRERKPEEVQPREVQRLWDELGGGRELEEEKEEEEEEEEEAVKEEEVLPHRGNMAPEDFWPPKATSDIAQGDAGAEAPPGAVANLNREFLAPAGEAVRAAWRAARAAKRTKNGTDEQDARDARRALSHQRIRERKPHGPSRIHENQAPSLVPTLVNGPVGDGARISLSIRHSANVLLATAGSELSVDGANLVAPALGVQAPLRRNQVSVVLKGSANVLSRHGSVQVVNGGVLVGSLVLTEEAPIRDSHISVALSNVGTVQSTDVRVRGGSRLVEAVVACGKVEHSSLTARVTSTANVNALLGGHVEIADFSRLLSSVINASAVYSGSLIEVSSVDIANVRGSSRNVSVNTFSALIESVVEVSDDSGSVTSSAIEVSLAHAANVRGDPQMVSLRVASHLIDEAVELQANPVTSSSIKLSLAHVANVQGNPRDEVSLNGISELLDQVVRAGPILSSSIQILLAHAANVEGHPSSVSITSASQLLEDAVEIDDLTNSSTEVSLAHVANVLGNPHTVLLEGSSLIRDVVDILNHVASSSVDVQAHVVCNVNAETLSVSSIALIRNVVNVKSDLTGGSSIHAAVEHIANFAGKNLLLFAGLILEVVDVGEVEHSAIRVSVVYACNVKAETMHAFGNPDSSISLLENAVALSSLTGSSVVEAEVQHTANFKGVQCNVTQFVGSLFLTISGPVSDSKVSIAAKDVGNALAQLTDIVRGGGRVQTVLSAVGAVDGALVSVSLDKTGNVATKGLELHEAALIEGVLESESGTIQNSDVKVRLVGSASIFFSGTWTTTNSTLLGPITDDDLTLAAIDLALKNTAVVKGRLSGVTTVNGTTLCADGAAVLRRAADKFANSCTLNVVHGKLLLER